jgi:hypothetical protein
MIPRRMTSLLVSSTSHFKTQEWSFIDTCRRLPTHLRWSEVELVISRPRELVQDVGHVAHAHGYGVRTDTVAGVVVETH